MAVKSKETQLVQAALNYLRLVGIFAWRNNTGAVTLRDRHGGSRHVRFGLPGMPDILGCMKPDGRVLAAEAKIGANKPTPIQAAMLDSFAAAGAAVVVFRSLDELIEYIEDLSRWSNLTLRKD